MPFALMRNGHEVIKGNVLDVQEYLDAGDVDGAISAYKLMHQWILLHRSMEEGNRDGQTPKGFFAVLDDKFDGLATKEGLCNDHDYLDKYEEAMNEAISSNGINQMKQTFDVFKTANEEHLVKEEDIMMLKVMALAVKAGENLKDIMVNKLLPTIIDSPHFPFFVKHANYILDKHHGGMPRARVFDHVLWAVATKEQ